MDKTLHTIQSCSISKLLREYPKFVSDLLKHGVFLTNYGFWSLTTILGSGIILDLLSFAGGYFKFRFEHDLYFGMA